MHLYMFVYVHVQMHMYVYVEARGQHPVSSSVTLHLIFVSGSLPKSGDH